MDCYELCSAICGFDKDQIKAQDYGMLFPYRGLSFTIPDKWEFIVTPLRIKSRKLGPIPIMAPGFTRKFPVRHETTIPWVVCACWIAIRKFWPNLYQICKEMSCSHIDIYTPELLRTLLRLDDGERPHNEKFVTMYLLASCIINETTFRIGSEWHSGNTLSIKFNTSSIMLESFVVGASEESVYVTDWDHRGCQLYTYLRKSFGIEE